MQLKVKSQLGGRHFPQLSSFIERQVALAGVCLLETLLVYLEHVLGLGSSHSLPSLAFSNLQLGGN